MLYNQPIRLTIKINFIFVKLGSVFEVRFILHFLKVF